MTCTNDTNPGYEILNGLCTRCARDTTLFSLREIADVAEQKWSSYADLIYKVEIHEGVRTPPAIDRVTHGAAGEPPTGYRVTRRVSVTRTSLEKQVTRSNQQQGLTIDDLD